MYWRPQTPGSLFRLQRRAEAGGVTPLWLRDARNTFAFFVLAAAKGIKWTATPLGHADPALILCVYAHALPDEDNGLSSLDFSARGVSCCLILAISADKPQPGLGNLWVPSLAAAKSPSFHPPPPLSLTGASPLPLSAPRVLISTKLRRYATIPGQS